MSEEKEKEEIKGLSRRQFLKDAGLVVGGATVGSMAILSACKGETTTVTSTKTVTTTAAGGGTVTVTSPGGTATVTVTSPPVTKTVEVLPEGTVMLKVNGKSYPVTVDPNWSLAHVLREKLALTGTKVGCDRGECGTCTILMNGEEVLACMVLACEAEGAEILTIEGLANGPTLHPVQKLFLDNASFQCGFCTPGNIMTVVALYKKYPKPTRAQAREALSGHLCWCIDYTRTLNTVVKGVS
jgi:aerobic-type carbon monoxide dehydrogenase small subunit (CoxS/CutS family)